MHEAIQWLQDKKIQSVMQALEKNNFVPHYVPNSTALIDLLTTMIPKDSEVAVGGSMSLFESGVIDLLRALPVTFYDRYAEGLTSEDIRDVYIKSFDTDIYFTSTNALTEDGCLFNVDGNGNRVAAMLYGPEKVFVIAGINKLVKDLPAAIERNRSTCAPANAKRLSRNTPCASTGFCTDCNSPDRVCADYVFMKRQARANRVHVFVVGEALGF